MQFRLPPAFCLSKDVAQALALHSPVVALESTVITHGLPYPENLKLAQDMEEEVRKQSCVPATIAVVDGVVHIGAQVGELARLAQDHNVHKISTRDFAPAIAHGWNGGTTVAGTLFAASKVGIRVFATGGIGGVHRHPAGDVSADLPQLARTQMIVVCAGAKAILDLPATLEYLETFAIPVIGYRTDTFPAFYATSSELPVSVRVDTPAEAAEIAHTHWEIGNTSAVLVVQPAPEDLAMPIDEVDEAIQAALQESERLGLRGQAVTPFLLGRVSELTHGESLQANLGLLRNNARLAAAIARELGQAQIVLA